MSNNDEGKLFTKTFQLEREFPDDLQTHFVTNVVIQHTEEYFTLSFFEVWPPPELGDTEKEQQNDSNTDKKIPAKCVARLVVTPARMRQFLDAMNQNFNNYQKMRQTLIALDKGEDKKDD